MINYKMEYQNCFLKKLQQLKLHYAQHNIAKDTILSGGHKIV